MPFPPLLIWLTRDSFISTSELSTLLLIIFAPQRHIPRLLWYHWYDIRSTRFDSTTPLFNKEKVQADLRLCRHRYRHRDNFVQWYLWACDYSSPIHRLLGVYVRLIFVNASVRLVGSYHKVVSMLLEHVSYRTRGDKIEMIGRRYISRRHGRLRGEWEND